jgi:Ca2+-binding RTX toxin-like protein
VENIIYNNSSMSAASTIDVNNIIGANITVNHTANALVAPDDSTISNVGTNNTVNIGTGIDDDVIVGVSASASGVTVNMGASGTNAGANTPQVNTGASVTGLTVNGGTSGALDVTLGATNTGATINAGSTAGTFIVDNTSATGSTITSGALNAVVQVGNIATSTSITVGLAGAATGTATDLNIEGTAATTDSAAISGSGFIDLNSNSDAVGTDQVETLDLSGNGAAVTYQMNAADQPLTVTMSGSQSVTMTHAAANMVVGTLTGGVTDSTTAGTTTVNLGAVGAASDLSKVAVDVIGLTAAATGGGTTIISVAPGQTIATSGTQNAQFGLDVNDNATTHNATATVTINPSTDLTARVNIDATASSDNITTVNLNPTLAQTALDIRGAATVTIDVGGAVAVTAATTTSGLHLDGTDMTGALTATASGNLLKITGGSGNDSITGVSGAAMVVAGGAGNDVLITADTHDYRLGTFTGFEVIDITNDANGSLSHFKASQMSGQSFIIKSDSGPTGGGAVDVLSINSGTAAGAHIDISTINLSGLTFNDTDTSVTIDVNTLNGALFTSTVTYNITGSVNADTINGYANADTINGGTGADIIDGNAGADVIDGGAGNDIITGDTGLNVLTGGAGADTFEMNTTDTAAAAPTAASSSITDFTTGAKGTGDDIGWSATNTTVTAATAAASGTAQVATAGAAAVFHADDSTLALKIVATEAAINASGVAADGQAAHFVHSGNTYIVISEGTDNMGAGDAVIELTGLDASANTLTIDTNHLVLI